MGSIAFPYPRWSLDGERILFYAGFGPHDIYAVDASGSDETVLADEAADEYWPSWSPDGSRIAFNRVVVPSANLMQFVVMDPDGTDQVMLDSVPLLAGWPIWSPDGTRVLGSVPDAEYNGAELIVLDASGDAEPTLIPAPSNIGYASWSPLAGSDPQRAPPTGLDPFESKVIVETGRRRATNSGTEVAPSDPLLVESAAG